MYQWLLLTAIGKRNTLRSFKTKFESWLLCLSEAQYIDMRACFVETSSWGHCKNYLKVRWHRSHEGSRTLTISLHTMHKLSISEVSKSSTSAAISSRNNGLLEVLLSDGGSLPLSRVTLSLPTPSELMSSAELELHSCTGLWWWPSGSWEGPGIHAALSLVPRPNFSRAPCGLAENFSTRPQGARKKLGLGTRLLRWARAR